MEEAVQDQVIGILICTSALAEGVHSVARRAGALKLPISPSPPGRSRLDEGSPASNRRDSLPQSRGEALWGVVGVEVSRDAAQDEQVGPDINEIARKELAPTPDRLALPGKLVQDIEHAESPATMGPVMEEVVGPDIICPLPAHQVPIVLRHSVCTPPPLRYGLADIAPQDKLHSALGTAPVRKALRRLVEAPVHATPPAVGLRAA